MQPTEPETWTAVGSSNVDGAVYYPDTGLIEVTFSRDGSVYTYGPVEPGIWAGLQSAPSAGRYVRQVLQGYQR